MLPPMPDADDHHRIALQPVAQDEGAATKGQEQFAAQSIIHEMAKLGVGPQTIRSG